VLDNKSAQILHKSILLTITILVALTHSTFGYKSTAASEYQLKTAELDEFIRERVEEERVPGLAIVVVQGDDVIYQKGFGVTSLDNPLPVTNNTLFELASCSKAFTALGVMFLYYDGLIELDNPVVDYLPEFKLSEEEVSRRITVRQLLNQTSGIPGVLSEPMAFHTGEDAMSKLVVAMQEIHPNREPGTSFEYTNLNYSLLGALIEEVTGVSFEEYMEKKVFTPLKMSSTTLDPLKAEGRERADGHQLFFGNIVTRNIPVFRSAAPAGWVMSNTDDMSKWLLVNLNEGRLDSAQLIPAEIIKEMHTPQTIYTQNMSEIGYTMGWFIDEDTEEFPVIWHGGDTLNFLTETILLPEQKMGVVMLVNSQNSSIMHSTAVDVINILLGTELLLPDAPWWASWKSVDYIAIAALWVSAFLLLLLIIYCRAEWIYARKHRRGTAEPEPEKWILKELRLILPITPILILTAAAVTAFVVTEFLFGFNLFRIVIIFGTYSPPGVWIGSLVTIFTLILWAIVLLIVAIIRFRRMRNPE